MIFFFSVPEGTKPTEATLKEKLLQMDIPGFLIITAAVVCYLLAMQWAGVEKSWQSADVIGTLVGSVVLGIAFLAIEWYQGERALLLPSILKNRTIQHGCAFSALYVFSSQISSMLMLLRYHLTNSDGVLGLPETSTFYCTTFPSTSRQSKVQTQ